MLVRLFPDQIQENWPVIRASIVASVPFHPEEVDRRMTKILAALIAGEMHCWVELRLSKDLSQMKPVAIYTTVVQSDGPAGIRSLLVYSSYFEGYMSKGTLTAAFDTLKKFAKFLECDEITCYTISRLVSDLWMTVPGTHKYEFLTAPVGGSDDYIDSSVIPADTVVT